MSEAGTPRKILAFASIVEAATGVALMSAPALVVRLLLGGELGGTGEVAARCFGVALVALALACWPGGRAGEAGRAAFRGMLLYNALIALYLAWLGTAARREGILLWPAAVLHGLVVIALVGTARRSPPSVRTSRPAS